MIKKSVLVAPFLLGITASLFYVPSLYYAFQFDDLANIVKFYDIRHKTFAQLFFSNTRWISYWLNTQYYKIAKFNPFYYRMGNVIFHVITGILIFCVLYYGLRRLKEESFFKKFAYELALCTAGLFLLHPVQTQTVSYVIQGQLEGLACLFMMSIMLVFLLYAHAVNRYYKIGLYVLFCTLCILACGTKEIVIVAPALLLVLDWFFVAQGSVKDMKRRWYMHATAWIIIGAIYIYFLKPAYFAKVFGLAIQTQNNIGNVLTHDPHAKITSLWYFISQFQVILHYLIIFVWPFSISVDYDWMLVRSFFSPECLFPLMLLCSLVIIIGMLLRQKATHLIAFGFIWFFVTILPRSSIIPSTELVADYKTYTASIGILFIIACALVAGINYIVQRLPVTMPQLKIIFLWVVLLPFGCATLSRNMVWRSGEEFWWNIIKNAPNKARAYNNYGVALSEKGKYRESLWYYKTAICMDQYYPDPCNNLAVAYSALGNLDDAIKAMKQGISIQPYYPEGYNNLASFLIQKKEYVQAEVALKMAVKLRPHYGKAHFNLGRLYLETDKKLEAFESFKSCCTKADFDNETGFSAYGMLSLALNKSEDAVYAYTKLVSLNSHDFQAQFNLANAYFMNKDFIKAEPLFFALNNQAPHDTKVLFNLAETYFVQNKYGQALHCFEKVAQMSDQIPQVLLRMAACHAKTGKFKDAQIELTKLLEKPSLPADLQKTAQLALNQINGIVGKKTTA